MGKGSGGSGKAHDYYGSIAGLVCCGPIDYIHGLLIDNKLVWPGGQQWDATKAYSSGDYCIYLARVWKATGSVSAGTAPPNSPWTRFKLGRSDVGMTNPFKLTLTGDYSGSEPWLYWGTSAQTLGGDGFLSTYGHPPYRNQVVLACRNLLFGRERQEPPQISLIGSRAPQQTLITGPAAALDADMQCNPFAFIAEMLTHPMWGLGFPNSMLPSATWQAMADWAYADAPNLYLSPIVSQGVPLRQFVGQLRAYVNGWFRWTEDGQIDVGRWLYNEATPSFTPATTVDYHDIADPAEVTWKSDGFDGTSSSVGVRYKDRQAAWKDRLATALSIANLAMTKVQRLSTLDLPFITRAAQASAFASQAAKVMSQRTMSGTLQLRLEKALSLKPGSLFLLTHDALATSTVCRITEKQIEAPPSGRVSIVFESEPGANGQPYRPTPATNVSPTLPRPARISDYVFLQLPPSLVGSDFTLSAIAARANAVTSRFDVLLRAADSSQFVTLGTQTQFAVAGKVSATFAVYTDGGGNLVANDDTKAVNFTRSSGTQSADWDMVNATQTADNIDGNDLLAIVVKASDHSVFEVMTIKSITTGAGSTYDIKVRRGRYNTLQGGTGSSSWAVNDLLFIVPRASLVPYEHPAFATATSGASAVHVRLVPDSAWFVSDPDDVYDAGTNPTGFVTEDSYTFVDLYAPAVTWQSETSSGTAVDFTLTSWTTASVFVVAVQFSPKQSDIAAARIVAKLGSQEVVAWSGSLLGKGTTIVQATFSLPSSGDWRLVATAQDSNGRVTTNVLQSSGADATIKLRSGTVLPPTASPGSTGASSGWPRSVTLSCATGGATIQYQLVSLGSAAGGSWTTYSGAISVAANKTLYARAYVAGPTYSTTISEDYWFEASGGGGGGTYAP